MARIVTVYNSWRQEFRPVEMASIERLKVSESLSKLGHRVDMATNEKFKWWQLRRFPIQMSDNLRRVGLRDVRWADYDVVITLYHGGFNTLEKYRGTGDPFIVSKPGSVVAPEDRDGIHLYGQYRQKLYSTQKEITPGSGVYVLAGASLAAGEGYKEGASRFPRSLPMTR